MYWSCSPALVAHPAMSSRIESRRSLSSDCTVRIFSVFFSASLLGFISNSFFSAKFSRSG